ncbi:Fub1p KNAG_0I02780 [Huiozyma naganishii CBS 8797]|uniref:PI31 proteasome regulator C-terminal domain-containing protein n=1 Tax=Huiozyma naganishii (strain ATCC MYA-139 / BCRC 22969 / CBS 8797 / KCTC 17520 / NBRC 10181 / NCYC 3082 / Yp74L-3) TaxID=1071383 RepID=J7RQK2_HUIN7|nr:hypothetical protein KNAG_0I02780 [Kazachstania naganishii CBS 8797]CCK72063.1 hypothetical protein KNAG_0I02780 [Kazachstania naganishii CBS 8797]
MVHSRERTYNDSLRMVATGKVQLAAAIVVECLRRLGFTRVEAVKDGKGSSDTVRYTVTSDVTVHLVVVEVEPGKKCMVTLYGDNGAAPRTGIFEYETDFAILQDTAFPVDTASYLQNADLQRLVQTVQLKLQLKPIPTRTRTCPLRESEVGARSIPKPEPLPSLHRPVKTTEPQNARPADMPGFDDEYEVNGPRGGAAHRDQFPGLSLGPTRSGGYGDVDLYPMGLRQPFGPGVGPTAPGQGGMIFDPFGSNRERDMMAEDQQNRGPGWMPGAKFDEPYGGSGSTRFGGGSTGFPGAGSGSGAGAGPGFM